MRSHTPLALTDDRGLPAAARQLLGILKALPKGRLVFTAPDGRTGQFGGNTSGPDASLVIRDWHAASEMLNTAEIGLAEAYRDGRLDTPDLTQLLLFFAENADALARHFYARPLAAAWLALKHWARSNTRRQATRNIQAHYDLSNAFYARWLDETMTYSSALFEPERQGHGAATEDDPARQQQALAEAQRAKYRRILDVLKVQAGARILEIGCGWGGFAEEAGRRGAYVHGLTLSPAQLDYARARMAREGLQDHVTLEIRDYRDSSGQFDHVVSIEKIEAVGERYWQIYFDTIAARLKAHGSAVVQAISIAESAFPSYRRGSDFIREYIFPGGMLAPLARMQQDASRAGLVTHDVHSFGLDYAHTLAIWQQRVIREAPTVQPLGFDERFLRLWRFYLSYCEAGFRCHRTDVHQLLLGVR